MNVKTLIIPLFLVLFCCVFGCRNKQHSTTDESTRDLPQIKDSGELVVLFTGDRKWDSSMNLASSLPKVWD